MPAMVEGDHAMTRCEVFHDRDKLLGGLRPTGQAHDWRALAHLAICHGYVAVNCNLPVTHVDDGRGTHNPLQPRRWSELSCWATASAPDFLWASPDRRFGDGPDGAQGARAEALDAYAPDMTIEERINDLEDTVIRISYVLELKNGAYSHEANPTIRDEGQLIASWARAVQERRAGT